MSIYGIEIKISMEDVALIMGRNFRRDYQEALHSATCPYCQKLNQASIEVESCWLNSAGDIILEGPCQKCGQHLERYVDTGIHPQQYDQAMSIRELKMEVLKDYEARLSRD